MENEMKSYISEYLESKREDLYNISLQIHGKPELGYNEHYAHELITSFLSEEGFHVEKSFLLPTAYSATFNNHEGDTNDAPVICK